ncbi:MAG: APC family permease [Bacillota bacterium]
MTELKKKIRLRTVVSAGAGLALATVSYTSNMQVASYMAGDSGWMAIILAGLISFLAAFCFAELVGMFPTAAGIKLFIERAFNEKAALMFGTVYMTISVAVVGAETYILSSVLATAFPVPRIFWIFFFLITIALINIRGVTMAGLTQDITTYAMFAALIGLSVYALVKNDFQLTTPLSPGSGMGMAQAVAIGVFLYLGFEWVTPLAEETTDFKLIPRGMFGAIALLGLTYALFNVAMTSTVSKAVLSKSPIPHVLFGQALFGRAGIILMMILSILASVTTFNAGVMTASRFIYAMARDRALPKVFSNLHPTYATPWPAIVGLLGVATAVSLVVHFTGQYKVLIFLGAAVECMIYVVMGASVLGLRKRNPETERVFKVPFGRLIPWAVIIIYGLLFVLIFIPDPANPGDARAQLWAFVSLVVVFALTFGYVFKVVPALRAKYEAEARKRQKRRPGRPAATGAAPGAGGAIAQ